MRRIYDPRGVSCATIVAGIAMLWMGLCAPTTTAQEKTATPAAAEADGLPDQLQTGTSLIYKDPTTGNVFPVTGIPDDLLKELQKHVLLQQQQPRFDIQKVEVTGWQEETFVRLEAGIRIHVAPETEWVRVPLGFRQFQLTSVEHTCDNEAAEAVLAKNELPEKNWLLRGAGIHNLKLSLIGVARVSQNGLWRIQVDAPEATTSHLQLQFSDTVESAQVTPENPFQLQQEDTRQSTLETWGLTSNTEISWTPSVPVRNQDLTIQSPQPAGMQLDLAVGSLTVSQRLSIAGGAAGALTLTLPSGFSSASVTAEDADNKEIATTLKKHSESAYELEFMTPVTGNITVRYAFEFDTTGTRELDIRLPDVAEVAGETGDLEVFVPVGMELDRELHLVRQNRVVSSRGPNVAVVGYRLFSEQSALKLTLRETEAFYSVVPQISLETESGNILMTARFAINIVRGSLSEIDISWPGLERDGWKILPGDTYQIVGETRTPLTGFTANSQTLRLAERMSGQFEIELQAFRPLSSDNAAGMSMFLPDIKAPVPHTTLVSLIESDEFSMTISGETDQTSFPQMPVSRWPNHWKERPEPMTVRMVDSPSRAVTLRITPQKPEVRVSVNVSATPRLGSLHVHEEMVFNVKHEELSELHLMVRDIKATVTVGESTESLQRISTDGEVAVYGLPDPLRGNFVVRVDFTWTPDNSQPARVRLPLILPQLADNEFDGIRFGTNHPETLIVAATDGDDSSSSWQRVHSLRHMAAWESSSTSAEVPVLIKHSISSEARVSPQFCILKSVVRGNELVTAITGIYDQPVDLVMMSVPPGVEPIQDFAFVGDDLTAPIDEVSADDQSNRLLQIRLRETSPDAANHVTVFFRQPLSQQSALLPRWHLKVPRILNVDPSCAFVWMLGQTNGHSLILTGGEMVPVGTLSWSGEDASAAADIQSATASLLAPYSKAVQSAVRSVMGAERTRFSNFRILTGTMADTDPVLVSVSRSSLFLAAAAVGLLIYFAVIRLSAVSILTGIMLLTAAATLGLAVAPQSLEALLMRLFPACAFALVAGTLHRLFSPVVQRPARASSTDHQSTIFTVENVSPSADAATVVSSRTESDVVSSHLSFS